MHELSIAVSLVEAAEQSAAAAGALSVRRVSLRIGALSGVVPDALLFAYDVAVQGTSLEGSVLAIESVPVTVYCASCDDEAVLASPNRLCCPTCGTWTFDVRRGRELEITSLEVDVEDEVPCKPAS